jgi:hypothetical protein
MKTQKSFTVLFFLFSFSITVLAQNPIATLEHKGVTKIFKGVNSFIDAYNSSVNGDTLILSTGFFNSTSVAKRLKIFGAGHFPDSTNVTKRTTIRDGIYIDKGADSLKVEGIYFSGDINFNGSSSIDYVCIKRCRSGSINFSSNGPAASKDNCSIEECYVCGNISFSHYGDNLKITNCFIPGQIAHVDNGALISNNIFFLGNNSSIASIYGSLIQNNIFLNCSFSSCIGSVFSNNIIQISNSDIGSNSSTGNYYNMSLTDVFVNCAGSNEYTSDYHLKNPEKYIGTDGTQIGLYGGTTPFKEKGLPFNPQITSKTIAHETDNDGNLNISVTVAAQER